MEELSQQMFPLRTSGPVEAETMRKLTPTFLIRGDKFSPRKVLLPPGYCFERSNEPGEIGVSGRFKNIPIPFGAAQLSFSGKENNWFEEQLGLFETILSSLRAAGGDDIRLLITIEYEGQCNWEISAAGVAQLAKLNVPLLLTCYELEPAAGGIASHTGELKSQT